MLSRAQFSPSSYWSIPANTVSTTFVKNLSTVLKFSAPSLPTSSIPVKILSLHINIAFWASTISRFCSLFIAFFGWVAFWTPFHHFIFTVADPFSSNSLLYLHLSRIRSLEHYLKVSETLANASYLQAFSHFLVVTQKIVFSCHQFIIYKESGSLFSIVTSTGSCQHLHTFGSPKNAIL